MTTTAVRAAQTALLVAFGAAVFGQQPQLGYQDTPMQPNGKWHIHDGTRPQPTVVTPGVRRDVPSPLPPSDAVVLIGWANDLSAWQGDDGKPVTWTMKHGVLETGRPSIRTKAEFEDVQLHVEFATPKNVSGSSQGRGNSGVFFGPFEIQVLDSFDNPTYPDGQASAMYGQYPPLVNASRPPGEWQTYDIIFMAPRFTGSGALDKPAIATVIHNGVVVHHATPFWGPTAHRAIGLYAPSHAKGPIRLQDHGNPIHFRNMWLRVLRPYDGV